MSRFIVGEDRQQVALLPECLDDFIAEDNTVRLVDAFVSELDMEALGFEGANPAATGRPAYHPALLLKLYLADRKLKPVFGMDLAIRVKAHFAVYPERHSKRPAVEAFLKWLHLQAAQTEKFLASEAK